MDSLQHAIPQRPSIYAGTSQSVGSSGKRVVCRRTEVCHTCVPVQRTVRLTFKLQVMVLKTHEYPISSDRTKES